MKVNHTARTLNADAFIIRDEDYITEKDTIASATLTFSKTHPENHHKNILVRDQDGAMHKAEEIWQNLLTEMINEETDMFQPRHWSWLKKKLYPLTHEKVRDFIPTPETIEIAIERHSAHLVERIRGMKGVYSANDAIVKAIDIVKNK